MTTMAEDITQLLQEEGRCSLDRLANGTGHKKKSLSSRLYDMKRYGVVMLDEEGGEYYLPNVEPFLNGNDGDSGDSSNGSSPRASSPRPGPVAVREDQGPISADQDFFERLLQDCDVRRARDTITRFFFAGDVHDLGNLLEVLEEARGYINPNQARLILRSWSRYIGADLAQVARMEERLGRPAGGSSKEPDEDHFIEGLGWTVAKDRDGDWIPKPGGELSHREALKWAATNNAIRQPRAGDDEDDEETPKGRKGRHGGGRQEQQQPTLLEIITTVKELFTPENSGKDDEVRQLREEMARMRETQEENRFQQLEGMITSLTNRNPIADFLAMRVQLNELAPPPSVVTDNSPTVQLLKDQTDKMDRGVNRLAGILERVALRGHDEIEPESRYTDDEREAKASAAIKSMEQGEESKQLRQELFGRSSS